MLENESLAQPVLGHQRDALARWRRPGSLISTGAALDQDFARAFAVDAEQDARERASSAAEQARDANHLTGIEREIDRNQAFAGRSDHALREAARRARR